MAGRTPPEPTRPFVLDFTPTRRLRRYRDLSQDQLAQAAGLHWTTVHRIENNKGEAGGSGNPSAMAVVALARAFGVPMHELFNVIDDPAEVERRANASRSRKRKAS